MLGLSDEVGSGGVGIGAVVGLLPLGVYATQTNDLVNLAQAQAPAIVQAIDAKNWVALVTAVCTAIPAVLAIIWPTSRK